MKHSMGHRIINSTDIFNNYFLDSKRTYLYYFEKFPDVLFVNQIDGEKAFNAFKVNYASLIQSEHHYRELRQKQKKSDFSTTIALLNNKVLLKFDLSYCQILYEHQDCEFALSIAGFIKKFTERKRRKPLEINLVVRDGGNLDLKPMEIKRVKLDLGLFYNDDFKTVDELIRQRLNKKNDKGIVMLYGLPGTGKTTYLRYLIGKLKKRVLFMSQNTAGNLADPGFLDMLVDNPNTVIIIEDAENIIMDRKTSQYSPVASLLNISDGLLADFLNIQLVCTFNNSLTLVDSALMRKGRLIASYEFGKLSVSKAQRLSNHLGFDTIIRQPMTLAEISNPHEKEQPMSRIEVIGFRRHELE